MTITRVHPGGWPSGGTVASAEATQIDIRLAKALDKSAAGDTFSSSWVGVMPNGSRLWLKGATLDLDTDGAFATTLNVLNGGIVMSSVNASMTVSHGSEIHVIGGGTTGYINIGNGGVIACSTGASVELGTDSVTTFASGSFCTWSSGAIVTLAADWILLGGSHPGQAQVIRYALAAPIVYGSGWTNTIDGAKSPAGTAGTPGIQMLPPLWNGATLVQLTLYFTPKGSGGRSASLPGVFMTVQLLKRQVSAGTGLAALSVVGTATYTTASFAGYTAGNVLALILTLAESIDRGAYEYAIKLTDESGANAVGETTFHDVAASYTITDTQPA